MDVCVCVEFAGGTNDLSVQRTVEFSEVERVRDFSTRK